jgi:hypothetical protein
LVALTHAITLPARQATFESSLPFICRRVQPTVDLGAHDRAVRRRMVEPAQQRTGQQLAGVLQLSDLVIEGSEPQAGDRLPLAIWAWRATSPIVMSSGTAPLDLKPGSTVKV